MERLQKIIANNGYASRRKAEELIKSGKVIVNGEVITTMGYKVNYNDNIVVDGVNMVMNDIKRYYLLYKPAKTVSTTNDELGRKTVVDLIETTEKIYPIGRLDYDTTGVLLLTNDGELTNILTHPRNEVIKTYTAKINGLLSKDNIDSLKKGIMIDGRKTNIVHFKVRKQNRENNTSIIELQIIEGRNHIVKNIFASFGFKVLKLKRNAYAFLDLSGLKEGKYRELSIKEVKTLYAFKK